MAKPIEDRKHRLSVEASKREDWWREKEVKDPMLFKKAWAEAREHDSGLPEIPPDNIPLEAQRALIQMVLHAQDLEEHWS